jgi:hypothetical protein
MIRSIAAYLVFLSVLVNEGLTKMLKATFGKGLHEVLDCHVLQERADSDRPEVQNQDKVKNYVIRQLAFQRGLTR